MADQKSVDIQTRELIQDLVDAADQTEKLKGEIEETKVRIRVFSKILSQGNPVTPVGDLLEIAESTLKVLENSFKINEERLELIKSSLKKILVK